MKVYTPVHEEKRRFVEEYLSPLIVAMKYGYSEAKYEAKYNDANQAISEIVHLKASDGEWIQHVCVYADSLSAIVFDVIKAIKKY